MAETSRAEHVAWAKQRALEYAEIGDAANCIASMLSDMRKHRETAQSVFVLAVIAPRTGDKDQLRRWVEGVN